jgi:hypothetical protein
LKPGSSSARRAIRNAIPILGEYRSGLPYLVILAVLQLSVRVFATAVLLLGSLQLFLSRTPLGRAIRATASDPDKISVERWSRLSIGSVAVALILILSAGPLFFGAGVIDKLTTLFIYIILAVTWNALAGYGDARNSRTNQRGEIPDWIGTTERAKFANREGTHRGKESPGCVGCTWRQGCRSTSS